MQLRDINRSPSHGCDSGRTESSIAKTLSRCIIPSEYRSQLGLLPQQIHERLHVIPHWTGIVASALRARKLKYDFISAVLRMSYNSTGHLLSKGSYKPRSHAVRTDINRRRVTYLVGDT